MAYLESLGYAYVTINNYLSGIIVLHRFYGIEQSFRDTYLVQTMLAGLKRRLGASSTPRLLLSIERLNLIYRVYPRSALNDSCWLAVIICFRTLLRKIKVVSHGENTHVLLREDVVVYPDRVVFKVRTSKTRLKGEEILEIPVLVWGNWGFCVVSQFKLHMHVALPSPRFFASIIEGNFEGHSSFDV